MSTSDPLAHLARPGRTPLWPVFPAVLLIALGFAGWLAPPVHRLGEHILLSMRPVADPAQLLGPHWLQELLRDFMGLGGEGVLVLFIAGGLGALWLAGRRRAALWFLGDVIGAFVIASVLKRVLARPRPELIPHQAYTFTASFPSGHTLMATVVWLWLALLLADAIGKCSARAWLVLGALVIAFLVGASRVYMGVHWPGDVVVSWGLGIGWVWLLRYLGAARVNVPS